MPSTCFSLCVGIQRGGGLSKISWNLGLLKHTDVGYGCSEKLRLPCSTVWLVLLPKILRLCGYINSSFCIECFTCSGIGLLLSAIVDKEFIWSCTSSGDIVQQYMGHCRVCSQSSCWFSIATFWGLLDFTENEQHNCGKMSTEFLAQSVPESILNICIKGC